MEPVKETPGSRILKVLQQEKEAEEHRKEIKLQRAIRADAATYDALEKQDREEKAEIASEKKEREAAQSDQVFLTRINS